MKNFTSRILSVFILSSFFISCEKNDIEEIPPAEEILPRLPKQVLFIDATGSSATEVVSIKYDTVNYKIELYLDDTTNTNPFDKLIAEYKYNKDGYLISQISSYDIFNGDVYTINRGNDNKINWILHVDNIENSKDTTFYQYQSFSDSTRITTVKKYYDSDPLFNYSKTIITTYDKSNRAIRAVSENQESQTVYAYNSNGSIRKKTGTGDLHETDFDIEFTYASGGPVQATDSLMALMLGRDFYFDNLKELYPFALFTNNHIYSFTDASGLSESKELLTYDSGGIPEILEERTYFRQTWNERNLLVESSFSETSPTPTTILKFKY